LRKYRNGEEQSSLVPVEFLKDFADRNRPALVANYRATGELPRSTIALIAQLL
jgi:hypothetical protein